MFLSVELKTVWSFVDLSLQVDNSKSISRARDKSCLLLLCHFLDVDASSFSSASLQISVQMPSAYYCLNFPLLCIKVAYYAQYFIFTVFCKLSSASCELKIVFSLSTGESFCGHLDKTSANARYSEKQYFNAVVK